MARSLRIKILTLSAIIGVFGIIFSISVKTQIPADTDWTVAAADLQSTYYSNLNQINKKNVKNLHVAWTWNVPSVDARKENAQQVSPQQAAPLKIGSFLYLVTSFDQVYKFDLKSKRPLDISFDPQSYRHRPPHIVGFAKRGLTYWTDGKDKRLFLATSDALLYALDLETLKPILSFGENKNGFIDLKKGLKNSSYLQEGEMTETSPPTLCRNNLIVGSALADKINRSHVPSGDVRSFDPTTGKLKWQFRTILTPQEAAKMKIKFSDEWTLDAANRFGHANVWAPMSADEDLGFVFLPVSAVNNERFGGERPGNNLFSQSLVALNCETGERIWHYQMVHHDVWDYDPPQAPVVWSQGPGQKIISQAMKNGFVYVFDAVNGMPRWPINECAVPASKIPGEKLSPTQPIPSKPEPFDEQGIFLQDTQFCGRLYKKNIWDYTLSAEKRIRGILTQYEFGGLYTPPLLIGKNQPLRGTLQIPGPLGGANVGNSSLHLEKGILFITSVSSPYVSCVEERPGTDAPLASCERYKDFIRDENGRTIILPLLKPPYGRLTAISLKTGEHLWQIPLGRGLRRELELFYGSDNLPPGDLGWPITSYLLTTPEILFVGQPALKIVDPSTRERALVMPEEVTRYDLTTVDPGLKAFDPETGKLITTIPLPMNIEGRIMTYMEDGDQYIVVPTGGTNLPIQVLALKIKK